MEKSLIFIYNLLEKMDIMFFNLLLMEWLVRKAPE